MNCDFVCDRCGANVIATIWDDRVICETCECEYEAHIHRPSGSHFTFRWKWSLIHEGAFWDVGGIDWEDMAFSEYIDQSIKLTAVVADYHDNNQEFPDALHVAKLMGFTVDTVIQMAEDQDLCVNVAMGVNGGVGELPKQEWTIEPPHN